MPRGAVSPRSPRSAATGPGATCPPTRGAALAGEWGDGVWPGPGHCAFEGSRPGLGRSVTATALRRPASPRPSHGRHGHMVGASAPRKGPVVAPCQCQAAGRPPAHRGDLKPRAARGPGGRGPRSGLGGATAPARTPTSGDSRLAPVTGSHESELLRAAVNVPLGPIDLPTPSAFSARPRRLLPPRQATSSTTEGR
jgi:hypothetical protein